MAPRIDQYQWADGHEAMLRFGPDDGPVIVAALPLFEEANRTRTFVVTLLRALASRGIASVLPDVPGQGESRVPLADLTLLRMADALAAVTDRCLDDGRRTYALGIRSGALLDGCARHSRRYHVAPQAGASLLRDLHRTWRTAGHRGDLPAMMHGDEEVEIAGNRLSGKLLRSLSAATPFAEAGVPRRVVRLTSDPADSDRKIDAAPLWRRTEPGDDPAFVHTLADDISDWLAICDA